MWTDFAKHRLTLASPPVRWKASGKEPFGLRFAGTLLLRFDLVFRLESSLVVFGGLYKFFCHLLVAE